MPLADRYRPIIFTDDASVLSVNEPPLSLDRVREQMIEPLEGTPASLWWSVGDHEVFHHETEIGEIIGDGVDDFEKYEYFHSFSAAQFKRVSDNTRHLMQTTGGPLTTLIGMCRQAGIEFFPRVRMNSHYRKDPSTPDYGRFRRDHPELLIGRPGEDIPVGSHEWHIRTGLNYAFPEVRRFMASIITELFERFDVDGVEMDFNRHPAFFRPNEAAAHGYLVTDLVRHVRRRMDEVGAARGKRILLAVRVPPTLADSRRVGLDVRQWIAEGLVDIVTAGIGFVLFDLPIREFVEAARGTGVKVYGCIEALRPAVDQRVMRAMAKRCWDAGADGVYLYNFFPLPGDWRRPILNEIADPGQAGAPGRPVRARQQGMDRPHRRPHRSGGLPHRSLPGRHAQAPATSHPARHPHRRGRGHPVRDRPQDRGRLRGWLSARLRPRSETPRPYPGRHPVRHAQRPPPPLGNRQRLLRRLDADAPRRRRLRDLPKPRSRARPRRRRGRLPHTLPAPQIRQERSWKSASSAPTTRPPRKSS